MISFSTFESAKKIIEPAKRGYDEEVTAKPLTLRRQ
jgi:hypothetical protein